MLRNRNAIIIALFCIVNLALHLLADYNSGYQGDELLHIQTGNHLAFGYMEFPPVIGWLAFIQNQFHSSSVFVNHIFVHLASMLIMVLLALITIELGGRSKAVFLVLLCIVAAPAFGRTHQLFQPVIFSQFFWVLSFYQLLRLVKTPKEKYLLYLTLSVAFGFLAKYDLVFFIASLAGLLCFARTRALVLSAAIWKYIVLFLVLVLPNIYWQVQHQLPALQMFPRLYQTQLNKLSVAKVIKDLVLALNPFTIVFWLGGFVFTWNKKDKLLFRPLAVCTFLAIILLVAGKSKSYYFFPVILVLFAFGCTWFEQNVLSRRQWILYPATLLLLVSGLLLMPFGMAVLPIQSFAKFAHIKDKSGWHKFDVEEYYSQSKWKNTLSTIEKVYDSLPAAEQTNCLLWGKHYSQAGAVELYGAAYHLPKAFSYHGSFYSWAPTGPMPATIIAFANGETSMEFFQTYFDSVTVAAAVYNPYANFEKDEWQTIYLCKGPKQSFTDMKALFSKRIFE